MLLLLILTSILGPAVRATGLWQVLASNISEFVVVVGQSWLIFGDFFGTSNTVPLRVRSPRPFCPCMDMHQTKVHILK